MPIKISIIDDVGAFLKGAGRVETALDDVAGSLDDVAREAQRTGTKAADALDDAGKDMTRTTETATEKMERSFAELADAAKKSAKKTGDAVGDETRGGTRKAAESVDEFKDEARQNLSEVASSFTGSMDSAADLVQGTLGGLAGSLAGPAGLIAAGLAAIGGSMYASFQESSEKSKQAVQDMFDDMLQSGQGYLTESFVQDEIQKIIKQTDDAAISWSDLQRYVSETGLSQTEVARAFAGDQDAAGRLTDALASKTSDLNQKLAESADQHRKGNVELSPQIATLDRLNDLWASQSGRVSDAQAKIDLARQAMGEYRSAASDATTQVGGLKSAWDAIDPTKTLIAQLDVDTTKLDRAVAQQRTVILDVVARPGKAVPI